MWPGVHLLLFGYLILCLIFTHGSIFWEFGFGGNSHSIITITIAFMGVYQLGKTSSWLVHRSNYLISPHFLGFGSHILASCGMNGDFRISVGFLGQGESRQPSIYGAGFFLWDALHSRVAFSLSILSFVRRWRWTLFHAGPMSLVGAGYTYRSFRGLSTGLFILSVLIHDALERMMVTIFAAILSLYLLVLSLHLPGRFSIDQSQHHHSTEQIILLTLEYPS